MVLLLRGVHATCPQLLLSIFEWEQALSVRNFSCELKCWRGWVRESYSIDCLTWHDLRSGWLFVMASGQVSDCSSINEHTPLVIRCLSERQLSFYPQDLYIVTDPDFSALIQDCEAAIFQGVYPQRIKKGSSGSYCAINLAGVCSAYSDVQLWN